MGWKEAIHAARRAEVGVTPEGIVILRANANAYGFAVNDDGRVIDPDTGEIITDADVLSPIMVRAQRQMVAESRTGAKLLSR